MSNLAYNRIIKTPDKDLVIFDGEIATPPMSREARQETGFQLRKLQQGELLSMPISRPMPSIGKRCHELRINDKDATWRIIYRIDKNEIVIFEVFAKNTNKTPKKIIETCKKRITAFDG